MSIGAPLLIDTITYVVTVHQELYKFLCTAPHAWKDIEGDLVPFGKIRVVQKKYSTEMKYYPTKNNLVAEIEVGATKSGSKFFKLTLHAGKFRKGEFERFQEHLVALIPDMAYPKLFATARVSRIDLASDSYSHRNRSFIPFRPYATCSGVWHDKQGNPGTVYVGSPSSGLRFRIYDKKRQMRSKKLVANWSTWTRLEAVVRNPGCTGAELHLCLKNVFATLGIAALSTAQLQSEDASWQKFLQLCLDVGSPMALSTVTNKATRALYRLRLNSSAATWWKPETVWSKLPQAVERIAPAIGTEASGP